MTRTSHRSTPDGFTLVELLVVMLLVVMISVVALPAILTATAERPLVDAAAIVQARLVEARDLAARAGWAGLRLVPSPSFGPTFAADGSVDADAPLAYTRIVPLVQPPPYAEGLAAIRTDGFPDAFAPWVLPGRLILEEAPWDLKASPARPDGGRCNPTSWYWTVRVGEAIQYQGRAYTVVGPMAVGPAGGNSEGFVNVGLPGTPSPLVRSYAAGDFATEFLYLANRVDDDQDGLVDEGWNGLDDDLDGLVDEADEWEAERWTSMVGPEGVPPAPYTLTRRPVASSVGAVELPAGAAIDATGWAGVLQADGSRTAPIRSRLPTWRWTGAVELTFDASGRIDMPSPYGRPAASPLGSRWAHFWISPIGEIAAPPSSAPGSARLVSADVFTGRVAVVEADPADPEASFARAEGSRP